MSFESADYISQLVSANPTAGDPFSQGDDHLRLIKKVLKQTFPGAAAGGFAIPITATEAELNYVHGVTSAIQTQLNSLTTAIAARVPTGVICMWAGAILSIPAGWKLCDGNNSTPDLSGKFVLGYGGGYTTLYDTGGYTDAAVITHTHVVTTQLTALSDSHTHTGTTAAENRTHTHTGVSTVAGGAGTFESGTGDPFTIVADVSGAASVTHTHTFTTDADAHTHNVTGTVPAPSGAVAVTGRNMPPYYVLAYIMKT